jgi:hypothetical protein
LPLEPTFWECSPPELPKAGDYTLSGDPATKDIDKNAGAGVAFTVSAKSSGADGALTKATIKDIDSNANTFTLVATWAKTATGIQVTAVQTSFDYELTVSAPAGGKLAVPAAGTITLSGGTDAAAASSAAALIPAS